MMSECRYCHDDTLDGQDLWSHNAHQICENERIRRESDGDCICCKKPAYGNLRCKDCSSSNNREYSGFKGPGQ